MLSKPSVRPTARPIYLKLYQFSFPLNAILSILHRITGVILILFLLIGLIVLNIWILIPDFFDVILNFWQQWWGKIFLWFGFSALSFHWLTGLRHLLIENNVFSMQQKIDRATLSGKILLFIQLLFLIAITINVM